MSQSIENEINILLQSVLRKDELSENNTENLNLLVRKLQTKVEEKSREIHFLRGKVKSLTDQNDELREKNEALQELRLFQDRGDCDSVESEKRDKNNSSVNLRDTYIINDAENYPSRKIKSNSASRKKSGPTENRNESKTNIETSSSSDDKIQPQKKKKFRKKKDCSSRNQASRKNIFDQTMAIWPTKEMRLRYANKNEPSNLLRGDSIDNFSLPAINTVQPMMRRDQNNEKSISRDILKFPKLK